MNEHHNIILPTVRPKKVRAGLYLDKELSESIKEIARRSDISYNEAFIELVKAGIDAYKE